MVGASTSHRPADVVADEAEAGGPGLLFHRSPKGRLSWSRHGVCLVQDNDLVGRTRLTAANTTKS